MKDYYVYMMASKYKGTIYIGVTNNLIKRVWEHKKGIFKGFTDKYGVKDLVYFEHTNSIEGAIRREKRLKRYKRIWKIELIEEENPKWIDLYNKICGI